MTLESNPGLDVSKIKAEIPPLDPHTKRLSKEEKEFFSVKAEGLRQDIHERKKYARRIFILCCCWVSAVSLLLLLQGFGKSSWFRLSDTVLLGAIGSTTANIIAVFVIVARYLFPDKGNSAM